MAANGISTLASKQARQEAKLNLAQTRRQAGGDTTSPAYRALNNYDIDLLPTKFSGNSVVDNANPDGLVAGRPWISVPGIVTNGLQLYLDPATYSGSGTSWTDSSANAYNVTLVGAPAYNTTHFTFDGSTEYFDTNQSLATEEFSVGMWFRTSAGGIKMLISKETAAGWPWNYRIWLNGGQIVGDIAQSGGIATSISSTLTNYNNGSWYYVMYTRNDSSQWLYVNGVQIKTAADTLTGAISNSQEVWFGRSAFTAGYQYVGNMGECFVYDRVLSLAEIQQNYNATKSAYGL